MKYPFRASHGLIEVRASIVGPHGSQMVTLAVDTGASSTLLDRTLLEKLGYSLGSSEQTTFTTGNRTETASRVSVETIEALGRTAVRLSVIAYTLPPSTFLDGVLGLDFFRETRLVVDFRAGELWLELETSWARPTPSA